jgi:hypothetical protein
MVDSSGIEQTVSYISEISQSKLTNNSHSQLDPEIANDQLLTTINV